MQTEYNEAVDKLTDKKNEIEIAEKEADKWRKVASVAKTETEYAQFELAEAERLKNELLGVVDGDSYLKEQIIELRYQNRILQEENRTLKDKLEKAEYMFMLEAYANHKSVRKAAASLQMSMPTFVRKRQKYEEKFPWIKA